MERTSRYAKRSAVSVGIPMEPRSSRSSGTVLIGLGELCGLLGLLQLGPALGLGLRLNHREHRVHGAGALFSVLSVSSVVWQDCCSWDRRLASACRLNRRGHGVHGAAGPFSAVPVSSVVEQVGRRDSLSWERGLPTTDKRV